MEDVCQLHEEGWRLSAGFVCVLCSLKRDGGCLSDTWDRLMVVCRECVYSVSYLRHDGCCLQRVCVLEGG